MTPEEQIEFVQSQVEYIQQYEGDDQVYIRCPYCGVRNQYPDEFCCSILQDAIEAVLKVQAMKKELEICKRVADWMAEQEEARRKSLVIQ